MPPRIRPSQTGEPAQTLQAFRLNLLGWAQEHQQGRPAPAARAENVYLHRLWNLAVDLGQDFPTHEPRPANRLRAAQLPEAFRNWTVTVSQKRVREGVTHTTPVQMNALDWLVQIALAEPTEDRWPRLIHWAVRSGFDPNRFNGRRTPVGEVALAGRADLLAVFHDLKADLVMALKAEHLESDAPGASARVGSTLLHRVVRKMLDQSDPQATKLAEVAVFLAKAAPASLAPDAKGWDPIAAAPAVLERFQANRAAPEPVTMTQIRSSPCIRR